MHTARPSSDALELSRTPRSLGGWNSAFGATTGPAPFRLECAERDLQLGRSLIHAKGTAGNVGGWSLELPSRELIWTEQTYRLFGIPIDETVTLDDVLTWQSPDAASELRAALEACVAESTPFQLDLQFDCSTRGIVWIRVLGDAEQDRSGSVVRVYGAIHDVTDTHRSQEEVRRLSDALMTTMESIADGLYTLDHDWCFTFVNRHAEQLLQRDRDSLVGRRVWDEFPDVEGTVVAAALHTAMDRGVATTVDEYYYAPLGVWVECRAFPSPNGVTVSFRDVTRRHQNELVRRALLVEAEEARERAQLAQLTLARQAVRDPLTGLYNRRAVTERLNRAGDVATVLFVDLDDFKNVNDSLGHPTGDELLVEVSHRLEPLVGRKDTLARLGGDEFVILTELVDTEVDALAERVLEEVRRPFRLASQRVFITASVGIATSDHSGGADHALRDADVALYRAKAAGRDRVARYDHAAHQQVLHQIQITDELRTGLRLDQLVLHYQPSFDAVTGRPVGCEALVRWRHPDRGLLPPGVFIPAAEEGGLIEELGAWCLRSAIRHACHRDAEVPSAAVTWVNVSVKQLTRPGLASYVGDELATAGLSPRRLGIEVTESAFAADTSTVVEELEALSSMGIRIAIDDFGTGYSSLWRLGALPVDVIKIDRSFVERLDTRAGRATVAAIIDLSHAVDAVVVAEGIESDAQLRALQELGCDTVSGFYLARPVPCEGLAGAERAGSLLVRQASDGVA